ncbi:DUF4382 domain-containing protein [Salinirubrum litoreum]|uniref:DUF4382 domain-containing protein n=1 Tax=Salinirubrum litoreum TaxID=1126234 RepID=A0ABD5RFG3_9EURY|nr:DUF4382 domain-containing protein [Salinirubrum litoreum]
MRRHGLTAILFATLVVLAGCTGGVGPGVGSTDDTTGTAAMDGSGSGTVQFYISDQPSAIEDFEHLNVTITQVGFQQADGGDAGANETEESDDETETNETEESDDETETNETEEPGDDETETNETEEPGDDETEMPNSTADPETDDGDEADEEDDSETEDADEDDSEPGDWETYDVDDRTVDLTRLQGANATRLTSMNVSNGTYSKVFVYVSEINATLENGEQVNVKLPSEKLQLNTEFTVGNGEAVDFVFDITVKKAGNSGKYILQPVVSESGTSDQVEIRDVDADREDRGKDDEKRDAGDDERDDERPDEEALNASFVGAVTQGENATLRVLDDGSAVENASVAVNDEQVGTTDADGELTFAVPDDRELDVEITAGDREADLDRRFAGEENGGEKGGNGNDDTGADYDFRTALA